MDPRYAIFGLLVGFLVGLTGVGGAALMTPLMIYFLKVKPTVAIGSDMAYSAITKIIGGFQHNRQGTVDHVLAWRLAMGSVPGGLLGVWAIHHLQKSMGDRVQPLVIHMLGFVLILVSAALLLKSISKVSVWADKVRGARSRYTLSWPILSGMFIGFMVGVTSVGSGSLFGVLMLVAFGMTAREMVGTDIFHAAILTTALGGANIAAGNVDFRLVGAILMGSIPGVLMGGRVSARLPEHVLRPVLAGVLLITGCKMI